MNKGEHGFPTSGLRTDSLCVSSTNKHKGNNTITCRKMCRVGKWTSHRKLKWLFNAHNLQLTFNMAYQIITLLNPAVGYTMLRLVTVRGSSPSCRASSVYGTGPMLGSGRYLWSVQHLYPWHSSPTPLLPHPSEMNEGFTHRTEDEFLFLSYFWTCRLYKL